jgi:WD40 repeat protein
MFCGGTDKSLEVMDLNKCQSSLIITDAHSRVFHQISQNSTEHNQHSYDLFLTNSIGDGIKLWDLRTARCVKKFEQHLSRAMACKTSQSSCGNYIATGSEDRSVSPFNKLLINYKNLSHLFLFSYRLIFMIFERMELSKNTVVSLIL